MRFCVLHSGKNKKKNLLDYLHFLWHDKTFSPRKGKLDKKKEVEGRS